MKDKLISEIRIALQNNSNDLIRETSSRFFKQGEAPMVYGVRSNEVKKVAKEFSKQIKEYSKQDIFDICEELWKSQYLEEAIIACQFTESLKKQYEPSDFLIFERWVNKYVNNWAACDTLCNHTIGAFIMMFPEYLKELKKWAKSRNRWTKRAAAVTLIIPARKGYFLKEIFEIADILLLDTDDIVQKGYGWMLKASSQSNLMEVFNYVISKREIMPRTAFRYAIEKMPNELKAKAMNK